MIQVAQCSHSVLKYIREAAESQNGINTKITNSYLLLALQMENGQEPMNVSSLWNLEKNYKKTASPSTFQKRSRALPTHYHLVRPISDF